MNLHEDKNSFTAAIVTTADHFKIPEVFIEKDYWVTYALWQIFHSDVKHLAVFKGGTALSKCYKIIHRFSEDIDLVMVKDGSESGDKLKRMMKSITTVVDNSALTVVDDEKLTNKKGSIRKLVYSFPKAGVNGQYGQVRENIIVEVSHLGSPVPNSTFLIGTLIAQYVKSTGQADLLAKFGLEDFEVTTLAIERTLCEKIISLVRFSYDENPMEALSQKVRHIYDLHQLLQLPQIQQFVNSEQFDAMLLQVGKDDNKSIPNDKDWLYNHPAEAIIFSDYANVWNELKKTYHTKFKEMVTKPLPDENAVLDTLQFLAGRVGEVAWDVER